MKLRWEVLGVARTLLLTVFGFGLICTGAFIWHPIAGCVASGVSLLVIEALTASEAPLPPTPPEVRR